MRKTRTIPITPYASSCRSPRADERLSALGFEPTTSTPAAFGARIKSEIAKWDKVVRAANIRIE